ncbi:MAG TPA: endonuclease/exonuclease/phosphatase family protein [Chitinispirillaceae bacterium]|nr:endonuclease/exonuclease/phosphatase family protein [Chitinispirillaceae bacterium]
MNYRHNKIVICVLFAVSVFAQYPSAIRVMTYNINAEKHGSGSYADIANVIKEIEPAFCGLQKVDSCNSRNSSDVLKWLAEQTGTKNTFAPAVKNYQGSTGAYGIGFLSKETPLSVRRLWIEHTQSEQDRGVLEIGCTMGEENVKIVVTHLAHEGESYRSAQIKKIISWIDDDDKDCPVIIMADFNAAPTENSMKQFETAGFNYVKGANGAILDTSSNQKINHILYRPLSRWSVVEAGNPSYSASNRNPVWAEMKLIPSSGSVTQKTVLENGVNPIRYNGNRIEYHVENGTAVSLSLYSVSGKKTADLVKNQVTGGGLHTINIDQSILTHGMYIVKYTSGRQMWSIPVVIRK